MGGFAGTRSYVKIIRNATKCPNGLLITSYEHFRLHSDELLGIKWGYVILDEGHKIKNPDADITLLVKRVKEEFLHSLFSYLIDLGSYSSTFDYDRFSSAESTG